ncbi:aldose epimerase family protein [Crateriforma spongiae]|uniref:aldose epimerase family protein n=1 Tax=Crateriforma spongiae TaxID=2724528 RepID=UPI00197EE50A|nr:aldose epimerase family protein [Crateriforma spongiae]
MRLNFLRFADRIHSVPCPARRSSVLANTLQLAAIAMAGFVTLAVVTHGVADEPSSGSNAVTVTAEDFGAMSDGTRVQRFTIDNGTSVRASVISLGATLQNVETVDRDGQWASITLHRDTLDEYLAGHPLLGSVVGRYANRISGASFRIDGETYDLTKNAGKHHIHGGGKTGFQNQLWAAEPFTKPDRAGVRLRLTSPDGEAGYPGTLKVTMTYAVTSDGRLIMDYRATTDAATVVNLTNHAYWNLAGADTESTVADHIVTLQADQYLVGDEKKVPTGEIRSVDGGPMDFRQPRAVGSRQSETDYGIYDHCYVIRGWDGSLRRCASVYEPSSGRTMRVHTTQPGVQLYTGNPQGLCLETQHFPDSPNQPKFPSTLLRPGQTFREITVHTFGVRND